jgi:hypothetical protein
MPHITFEGNSSAYAFGFMYSIPPEPPGSYNHPNGYAGQAYQPQGHAFINVTVRGAGAKTLSSSKGTIWGKGSSVTKNNVTAGDVYVYSPTTASGGRLSQWNNGSDNNAGSGGTGGTANMSSGAFNGRDGGGVGVAFLGGQTSGTTDVMVAAGAGGASYYVSRTTRRGMAEGFVLGNPSDRQTNAATAGVSPSSNTMHRGGNGGGGVCYYGGGGGGGGYSRGGNGGARNNGGMAGGNGAAAAVDGTGSFGYDSVTVDDNDYDEYNATISWG